MAPSSKTCDSRASSRPKIGDVVPIAKKLQANLVGYSRTRDSCAMGDFVVPSGGLPQLIENGAAKVAKACVEEGESICPLHFSLRPKEVQDSQALHLRPGWAGRAET